VSSTATLTIFGGAFLALLLLAPGRVGERLHAWAFGFCVWLMQRPFVAVFGLGKLIVALVGQEVARWLAVGMSGLLVYALAWSTVRWLPEATPGYGVILLCVALLGMIWFFAVLRAAKLSAQNRLWRVRQQQFFRQMSKEAAGTRQAIDRLQKGSGRVVEGVARRTRGTPFGGVFRANRDHARDEQAQREIAAQREAEQRQAEAERVAADRHAKERRDRWAEQVATEHDPFERQGS
jgi:hypothetical protein